MPMEQNLHLSQDSRIILPDGAAYRRLVGRLLYLTITRPDISFVVEKLSQFMNSPYNVHLHATHQVL